MLIEEGALLPESVDPKASPGPLPTCSYMAGGIIRELRKPQEIKRVSVTATKNDIRNPR